MDETEEMIKLLLTKSKMLKHHCPRCSLPLFERDKKVICVRCGEVKVKTEGGGDAKGRRPALREHATVLREKRDDLLKQLKLEEDPEKIVFIVEAISKVEELLKIQENKG
jgi:uncharacterized Zn finger protein (UPF0148 family)